MFAGNYFGQIYFGQSYPSQSVGVPTWVSPANHASGLGVRTTFVFIVPQTFAAIHFQIQIDTANTFNTGSLQTFTSSSDQTGWEYYNGTSWTSVPSTGVPTSYVGQQARYTLQSNITLGTWYRRIRGRVVI